MEFTTTKNLFLATIGQYSLFKISLCGTLWVSRWYVTTLGPDILSPGIALVLLHHVSTPFMVSIVTQTIGKQSKLGV